MSHPVDITDVGVKSGLNELLASSLNVKIYPGDDYCHVLGYGDPNHTLSRLQDICRIRLQDVARDKTPIDTVSNYITASWYIPMIYILTSCSKGVDSIDHFISAKMTYTRIYETISRQMVRTCQH